MARCVFVTHPDTPRRGDYPLHLGFAEPYHAILISVELDVILPYLRQKTSVLGRWASDEDIAMVLGCQPQRWPGHCYFTFYMPSCNLFVSA